MAEIRLNRFLVTGLVAGMMGLGAQAQTYTNPVFGFNTPDPSIQRAPDGKFYCYATGCQTRVSDDLMHWEDLDGVFSRPTWNDSTHIVEGKQCPRHYSLWACDCNYVDGKYIMYYASAYWGDHDRTGIGVAVGTRPDRLEDYGRMFRSTEIGVKNSIDPCYVRRGNKKYLVWGSFFGLYLSRLTPDGLAIADFDKKIPVAGNAFEGVMVYRRKGYYYLFASIGTCCEGLKSTYSTVVGRSRKLTGPYLNKEGGRMLDNQYTLLIKGNERWKGPGHNSEIITDDNGDDWILYHAFDAQAPEHGRVLLMDKLEWSEDGWPSVAGGTPSTTERQGPVFR